MCTVYLLHNCMFQNYSALMRLSSAFPWVWPAGKFSLKPKTNITQSPQVMGHIYLSKHGKSRQGKAHHPTWWIDPWVVQVDVSVRGSYTQCCLGAERHQMIVCSFNKCRAELTLPWNRLKCFGKFLDGAFSISGQRCLNGPTFPKQHIKMSLFP